MTVAASVALELDDIQAGTVRARPTPYVGVYLLLRIDARRAGRELLKRLIPALTSAADPGDPDKQAYLSAALSFQGLKALGVPEESLASFPDEFAQGMAARAELLGDTGESAPDKWESPLGSPDVHIALAALSPDTPRLEAALQRAGDVLRGIPGVEAIWRQDVYALANERTSFGFKDGISHPAVGERATPGTNPLGPPQKAGKFALGCPKETGALPPMPRPEV